MRRREFIGVLAAAAVWPVVASAQPPAVPVIGFLNSGSADVFMNDLAGFRVGLSEVGYVEGRNVAIEYRWAGGQYDRLPELAADLARREKMTVIVASGGAVSALAAKAATSTIPIVFVMGDDPVKFGIVASLSRPSSNVTGVTLFISELMAKRLELLISAMPGTPAIAMLVNPKNPNAEFEAKEIEAAARTSGRGLRLLNASTESDIEVAFESLVQQRLSALLVGTDTFFYSRRDQLVALAARHSIPVIYFEREFVAAGGLMSYGPSFSGEFGQAGIYAGRILKGEKPGDLPVLQPTKFEFVINLKTAKALGLIIPPALLARADEVIE
jgi:putative tryptophan/tyrosine transport system substrate-binding protein